MTDLTKKAFQLIILLGLVSLLGDIIYEGARGANGQYLNILGVNAAKVGFIVGLGELLGYLFRLFSGFFADKTKSYWFFTILGYGLLISVPLISFVNVWQAVAFLIVLERIGKGIRSPARDTIVSHAAKKVGTGYGFGIAEFIDQIGAVLGPLIFSFVFLGFSNNQNIIKFYQRGYSLFFIPFVLLLLLLFFAYIKFKKSEELEISIEKKSENENLTKNFWLYWLFVFLTTAGFVNFALLGFHLKKNNLLSDFYIPLLYAGIMAIDAIFGLMVGKIYDKLKTKSKKSFYLFLFIPFLAGLAPFFVFSKMIGLILIGALFLGFVIGAQETIMKAIVADIVPIKKRSSAYGIFNFSFGFAFFAGGILSGYLYDYSVSFLVAVLGMIEFLAMVVFYSLIKTNK